jgi:cytochrome c oxidase subunit 2
MNELMRWLLFLPPQASSVAIGLDRLHYLVILTTIGGSAFVALVAVTFLIRFRRTPSQEAPRAAGLWTPPVWLELAVIVGMFSLFVTFWWLGSRKYMEMRVAPADSMNIYVTGKQWMWQFSYPEGRSSIAKLYVPAGRSVRLTMTSRDVIHSFFVPDFRVKQDLVPGRYTTVWFKALKPGVHEILCAEYCGTDHSTMRGEVVALSAQDYAQWLQGLPPAPTVAPAPDVPPVVMIDNQPRVPLDLAQQGEIVAAKAGCQKCHTTDGSAYLGPTWVGLYDSTVTMNDGTTVRADAAYLTESMMDPGARIVRGFANMMPSYLGKLEAAEVGAILEFMRTIRDRSAPLAGQPAVPAAPADARRPRGVTP